MIYLLAIAGHILCIAAVICAAVVGLYVVVAVCRKALAAQAVMASQDRLHETSRRIAERIMSRLAETAAECYEAEVQAIYEADSRIKPPTMAQVTGADAHD